MDTQSIHVFREACAATGPLRFRVEGPGWPGRARHTLPLPFALIGRHIGADLALDDEQVSRRHAYLQVVAGHLFCVDLRARAGTEGEVGAGRSGWLAPDRAIRVGPYSVRLLGDGDDSQPVGDFNPLVHHAAESSGLPAVALEFLNGSRKKPLSLKPVLTLLGRSDDCRVALQDRTVSFFHCSLLRTRKGVWVIDLLGRGGVGVNGQAVRWALLRDGDVLQVGRFTVRLRYGAWPDPLPDEAQTFAALMDTLSPPSAGDDTARPGVPRANPFPVPAPLGGPLVAAGHLPARGGAPESLLVPLVSQFALMQQQMFDQFQQALLKMIQMFGMLHKDQLGLIRVELDRIHELTQELQELKAEFTRDNRRAHTAPNAVAPAAPPLPAGEAVRSEGGSPPAAVNGGKPPAPAVARPAPAEGGGEAAAMPESPAPAGFPPATDPSDQDVHVWLHERITALQKEREGHWQKILNFMRGK
jgi:hypothetical protein